MSNLKRIAANASWMSAEQIVRLIIGLLVSVWIARHLGAADLGSLNYAIAISTIVGVFGTLGLARIVVRELVIHGANASFRDSLMSTVLTIRVCSGALCFSIAASISFILGHANPLLVAIISFGIIFMSFDVVDQYFQSISSARISVFARSIVFFASSGFKVFLLLHGAGVVMFAIAATLEVAASAMAMTLAYRLTGLRFRFGNVDLRYGLGLIRQSWPEIFAGFAVLIFMRIDQLMLGNMVGDKAVGIYSVGSRLAEAWYFIPQAVVTSTFPALVQLRRINRARYMTRLHHLTVGLMALAYSAGLGATFLGGWAINLLYGPNFAGATGILVVLVWCGVFVTLGITSGSWIMAEGRLMLNLWRNMFGAGANVCLNLMLIPRYGAIGAAYGTLASQSVAYFAFDFFLRETRPIAVMKLKSLLLIWK